MSKLMLRSLHQVKLVREHGPGVPTKLVGEERGLALDQDVHPGGILRADRLDNRADLALEVRAPAAVLTDADSITNVEHVFSFTLSQRRDCRAVGNDVPLCVASAQGHEAPVAS